MKAKEFDDLGAECFGQLREINPKGGLKEFIRMATEFGYKRAVSDRRELFNKFYEWLDGLSQAEYDDMSLTGKCEKFFFET